MKPVYQLYDVIPAKGAFSIPQHHRGK